MQRIREIDTALIKGSRNPNAAPNQQQLNYVPCFIPAGKRESQSFAVTSKYSLGIPPYVCGDGTAQHPCYTFSLKARQTRPGDFPVLKESINSVLCRRDYRFQFT